MSICTHLLLLALFIIAAQTTEMKQYWRHTCPAKLVCPLTLVLGQLQQISYVCFPLAELFTAMVGPPQEVGDPTSVWQVFKSVFKNLNSARAASQEMQYLTSLTQIVLEYPQALVATSTFPDLADKGSKRDAVTSALVRRLIHCQAVQASSTMAATVELLNLVLSVLHRHSLTR